MKRYFIEGICNKDRNKGITEIEAIINKYGFIVDFKMYSDISVNLVIEINENKIDMLYEALKLNLNMFDFKALDSKSEKEVTVFLSVTFARGSGNMKIEVPSVPG